MLSSESADDLPFEASGHMVKEEYFGQKFEALNRDGHARFKAKLALMVKLPAPMSKRAQGREISGLSAYA